MNRIVDLDSLSLQDIHGLIEMASAFKAGKQVNYQQEKVVANLFFEPSTRTHYSFDMAEGNLGCRTQNFEAMNSSLKKGESLYDTCKFFESIGCDALVIRHPDTNYFQQLDTLHIPILNAGDGSGNHPSQSLLDLMTIQEEFGQFQGLKVLIIGDIIHSRVAHSHYHTMKRLGMEVYTAGPLEYQEKDYHCVDMDDVLADMDVVMLLRIQHERHDNAQSFSATDYHQRYGLTKQRYEQLKKTAIIMHPAPINRGVEIADDLVESEKSRIFQQMHNGVYMRMAMLQWVLNNE